MSNTYRKWVKCGNCVGSNTQYYRNKRKAFRRKAKQDLHTKGEDFVNPEQLKVFKNTWEEPTDGSFLVDKKYAIKFFSKSKWLRKFLNILKPKKRKHETINSD